MEKISLTEFKERGLAAFKERGVSELRIESRKGYYISAYLHNIKDDIFVKKDGDVLIDKNGKRFRECALCGSLFNVRYVVPFDGSYPAGAYCYYCRRKRSIMDVKDAKRYGKIL